MSHSKKDRLSEKQPETVTGVGAGLQIATANVGEITGVFSGDRSKNSGKSKGKNKK